MSQLNVDTLASQTGTLISLASSNFANFGIIQVQSWGPLAGSGNQLEATSSTYADVPNLTLNITPKVATSKIFVMAATGWWMSDCAGAMKLVQNSSGSYVDVHEMLFQGADDGAGSHGATTTLMGLIDHNTTSEFTVKLQGKSNASHGSNRFRINWYDQEATGFAFEIGNI
tara:strand:+ start:498 stop:1010 length:513 start_codon:yes stop_codon:yes gene_type:complete